MNIGQRGGCTLPFALLMLLASAILSVALAQTPNPVTPGFQIPNASGQGTSWQPTDLNHPFPVMIEPGAGNAMSHISSSALVTSLVVKATPGNLYAYNCTSLTGGAAGFCIAYNGAAAPSTGALTGSLVLDFCFYDTTVRGCSLSRIPLSASYSAGIVILVSSAASPYTYTTGTATAAVSADFQ